MQKQGFGKHLRDRAVVTATILALVGAQSAMAQLTSSAGPYGPSVRDRNATTPISAPSSSSSAKTGPLTASSPRTRRRTAKRSTTFCRRGSSKRTGRPVRPIRRPRSRAPRTLRISHWRRRRRPIRRCLRSMSAAARTSSARPSAARCLAPPSRLRQPIAIPPPTSRR